MDIPFIRIEPSRSWLRLGLKELWDYRELLYFLVWRDVKVRYKQTAIGAAWAIIQPLLTMVIFTVVFGNFAKMPSDGLPYPIFIYAALLPWTYFCESAQSEHYKRSGKRESYHKSVFSPAAFACFR